MAVVYLNSIAEQRLLYRDARFLLFDQTVQSLGDGGIVDARHAAFDLVSSDGFLYAGADCGKIFVCSPLVAEIVPSPISDALIPKV
jgi:hypothetical protein